MTHFSSSTGFDRFFKFSKGPKLFANHENTFWQSNFSLVHLFVDCSLELGKSVFADNVNRATRFEWLMAVSIISVTEKEINK